MSIDDDSPSPSLSPLNSPPAAPPGINVLEHESIALGTSSTYSTFNPPSMYPPRASSRSVDTLSVPLNVPPSLLPSLLPSLPPSLPPQPLKPNFTAILQPRELPRQRLPESFKLVTPLPVPFSLRSDTAVSLYRARMENRNVVLRVLKGEMVKYSFNGRS